MKYTKVIGAAVLGLVLGWYLSTCVAGSVISVKFIFHRALAALAGAASASSAVYLWKSKKRSWLALAVVSLGVLAIMGMGFLMGIK